MGERKRPGRTLTAVFAAFIAMTVASACSGGGGRPNEVTQPAGETPAAVVTVASATPSVTATPIDLDPGEAVEAAHALLREGRFDEAGAAFERAVGSAANAGEASEAWLGASIAADKAGDEEGALDAVRLAVELAPAGSSVAVRAAYVGAARLNDAGEFGEAERVARGVSAGGALGPYLEHELARALAGRGDRAAADAVWDGLLAGGKATATLQAEVLRERARLAREAGDDVALGRWLDALVGLTSDPAARYERAAVALRLGDEGRFASTLMRVIVDSPGSRYASLAIGHLREAGVAIDPGDEGLVYYRRGAYQEAKKVLEPALADGAASPAQLTFRAYYLAASHEDSGDAASAVRYYDVAAGTGAVSPYVHRARYWAARVTEDQGKAKDASARYVQLALGGPAGEFSEEAAFRAGFVLLRGGDTAGALDAWRQVGVAGSARLEYWRGRALEQSGDSEGAKAAYQLAVAAGPFEFHGLEAAVRLGQREPVDAAYRERDLVQPIDWDGIAAWLRGLAAGNWSGSPATAACELARLGFGQLAKEEIEVAARDAGAWRTLELAREASGCGLTDVGAHLAVSLRQMAGVDSHEPPADLLRVSYPIAFSGALDEAAREARVDPLFLAALVRQESYWDATAGSSVGALGLTQVMPQTGEGIAVALGVRDFSPELLFRPAVALEFGGYYLGGQVKRFGDPLLALAAYNAGPGNALRWSAMERATAADLVESIDFSETKHYVMYIVEAYAHYELAWGE